MTVTVLSGEFSPGAEPLWRYLDLAKLTVLLANEALFFASLKELDDPWEGEMPRELSDRLDDVVTKQVRQFFREAYMQEYQLTAGEAASEAEADEAWERSNEESPRQTMADFLRDTTYVCSWYQNAHESMAMWDLYAGRGAGVAIRTSVESRKHALGSAERAVEIGRVRYQHFDSTD